MSTGASPIAFANKESTSPLQLVDQGITLRHEFEARGRREDLDQSIHYQNQAVSLTAIDHEDYSTWLDELGVSLQLRFRHFDDLADITSAVGYHEQAVDLTPNTHRDHPKRIKNLGNALQSRFERLGDSSDLKRGIHYLNQAIMLARNSDSESILRAVLNTSPDAIDITPVKIDNSMSSDEILGHLIEHGCPDLTHDLENLDETPIAYGGLGLVYRATLKDGSIVAVKTLASLKGLPNDQKSLLKQAAHELHVWSKCTHSYIQELLGVSHAHDQIAMISPWLEHGTLPEYLKHHPTADRLKMCIEIAEGLTYLHRRGIIHGDIKGCNILVGDDHTPKLTDFGNGALQDYSLCFATTTTKNHISWRWTSPELYDGGKESKEADVYALGMTILEVIMGKLPFHGMKESQIMRFVTAGRIHERPVEFIPVGSRQGDILWSILLKCWAYESADRPTPAQVWKELLAIAPDDYQPLPSTLSEEEPPSQTRWFGLVDYLVSLASLAGFLPPGTIWRVLKKSLQYLFV